MSEQNPQRPIDVLPDTPEEQPDRSTIMEAYKLSDPPVDEWENYGDASPAHHGGLWISYNGYGYGWSVYQTTPATELFDREEVEEALRREVDFDEPGHQYVVEGELNLTDIIAISGQWADGMQTEQDELTRGHPDPVGAIVDGDLTKYAAHYATGMNHHNKAPVRDSRNVMPEGVVLEDSYADVLDFLGVEPAEGEL